MGNVTKTCRSCEQVLPLSAFYRHKAGAYGVRGTCKACSAPSDNARRRAYRLRHLDHENARARRWKAANRRFDAAAWRQQRESILIELLERQNYTCPVCSKPLDRHAHGFARPVIDHDHSCCPTIRQKSCGRCYRGALHNRCNVMLGYAGDNPSVLRRAAGYLERGAA